MKLTDNLKDKDRQNLYKLHNSLEQYKTSPVSHNKANNLLYYISKRYNCAKNKDFWGEVERSKTAGNIVLIRLQYEKFEVIDLHFLLTRNKNIALYKIGEFLKAGDGCILLQRNGVIPISWNNWALVANMLRYPDCQNYDFELSSAMWRKLKADANRQKRFDEYSQVDVYKKKKRGHAVSFAEHKALYRKSEKRFYEARVENAANRLMQIVMK